MYSVANGAMSKDTLVPANTSLNRVYSGKVGLEPLASFHINTFSVTSVKDPARAEYGAVT